MKDTETPDISKKETKTVRLDNVQFAIIIFSIYAT